MKAIGERRRPPSLYALIVVVISTVVGVGLFVWGPINPNVSVAIDHPHEDGVDEVWLGALVGVGGSSSAGRSAGFDGRVDIDLFVTNHGFAPVELVDVHLEAADDNDAPAPRIEAARGIPATVGHDATAEVRLTLDTRAACAGHPETDFGVVFDGRTTAGIRRSIAGDARQSIVCAPETLPEAGPGPTDPDAARAAIARTFTVAYDFSASPADRRAVVDDPTSLEAVVTEVTGGPYESFAEAVEPHIVEIVFTSPTRASVLYDLTGLPGDFGTGEVGEVRFVDGHWKITRSTVCADLAMAEVRCPDG